MSSALRQQNASQFGQEKISQVASILSALTTGRDATIFTISDRFVHANYSSGLFGSLPGLSSTFSQLCAPLGVKVGAALVLEIDQEARSTFNLVGFADGALAIICLSNDGGVLTCAALYESASHGLFSPDKLTALQATAKLFASSGLGANREIAQVRNFYRRFSDAIRQCFWIVDTSTTEVLNVSENFETVWGAPRSILMTGVSGFMANVLPEDRDRVLSEFHTHLDAGEVDMEFRVLDQEGEIRWMWLRKSHFEDETSYHLSLLIADDITDRKQVQEQERHHEADLVTRARSLAVVDLASGVAHEINNPLTIIVGRASELKKRIEKGLATREMQLEAIDKIQSTALRIADIVKSLKSLARQDRGSGFQTCDFSVIAREVHDLSSERFKASGVDLKIEAPRDDLKVQMNPTLISQLILNLAYNALDAVAELDQKWVAVEFTDDADSIYISVTDSGAGIPIKNRSRIFDPFFTTKDPGKGTGLGLALSMSIAAHHGGALRLDTLHPHTRFVLQMPKQTAHQVAKSRPA